MATMSTAFVFMMLVIVVKLSSAALGPIIRKVYTMCRDMDIDILSSTGVKIEPYDRSLVQLHFPDSFVNNTDWFHLEFSIQTRSSDGVLFYTRSTDHPTEIMAFYLRGGHLIYKLTCPTLAAVDYLTPTNKQPLNDGKWHNITFGIKFYNKLNHQKANITIDGHSPIARAYRVSCHRVNSLIVGGWRDEDLQYMYRMKSITEHFDGCIRNMKANLPLRSPPKYIAVSSCD